MPFVNAKTTIVLDTEKKEKLKSAIGQALKTHLGKPESHLMVGFEDNCCLYFGGNDDAPSAFIDISILGTSTRERLTALTGELCTVFNDLTGTPKDRIYIKYEEVTHWGHNGYNF